MPSPFDDLIRTAFQHHQAGQLAEAEHLYRYILKHEPNHPDALHLLGVIALSRKDYTAAIDQIRRALFVKTDFAPAYHNLGLALQGNCQTDQAIDAFRHAVTLSPNSWEFQSNLGAALRQKGLLDEAVTALERAVALAPDSAPAHTNLGLALRDKGLLEQSISAHRRAIVLDPNFTQAHNNLGIALKTAGQLDPAIASYRLAIAPDPNFADAHFNLGQALLDQGAPNEAIASFQIAIQLNPSHVAAINNLALAHFRAGHYDLARAGLSRVLALDPNHANAHWNLGTLLLLHGDFENGWREYEWRFKLADALSVPRNFPQPQWTGREEVNHKTILLHAEQGLGDAIQFVRYAPLVAERGAIVIVDCQPVLCRLFRSIPGIQQVIPRGQPLPPFDFHCPLLSVPLAFGATLQTIPSAVPYLHAPTQAQVVRESARNVGLCWAGNPLHKNDRARSLSLADHAPLGNMKNVHFYSLQKREAARSSQELPFSLIDRTADFMDLADAASLISALDLVITVDTSIAHLAGALGKKVWTLLPYVPDWRWMLDRDDSPWYPTMRLFRQTSPGDWAGVLARVRDALTRFVPQRD